MKKYKHTDPAVGEFVKSFLNRVVWLKSLHYTYKELYEDDEAVPLMEKTATSFFCDLNTILVDCLLLESSKITDAAATWGHDNFSVDNLITSVDWPPEVAGELEELRGAINAFRAYIKTARNKLLAHLDKKTILNDRSDYLGAFPKGEDDKFLSALENIVNIAHKACFGSIAGDIVPFHSGDVYDLKRALRGALAFERLFKESKGSELVKLNCYIEEAGIF